MANRVRDRDYYVKAMAFCRSRREEIGLKQLTVANRLGVSQDTYWRWESGDATLTDGQLKKLLKILESSQEELDAYISAGDVPDASSSAPVVSTPIVQAGSSIAHPDPLNEQANDIPTSDAPLSKGHGGRITPDFAALQDTPSPSASLPLKAKGTRVTTAAFLLILAVGVILAGVKGTWLRNSSPPPVDHVSYTAGQQASRPWLFQACYAANKKDLGEPTSPVQDTAESPLGETGEWQRFVGGSIYLSDHKEKAYAVIGYKALAHERTKGVAGPHALGFPTSDVGSAAASQLDGLTHGTYQRFERGSIYESSRGAYPVVGAMSREHEQENGTAGKMGFPTGMPEYRDGKIIQDFEGGRFTVDAKR